MRIPSSLDVLLCTLLIYFTLILSDISICMAEDNTVTDIHETIELDFENGHSDKVTYYAVYDQNWAVVETRVKASGVSVICRSCVTTSMCRHRNRVASSTNQKETAEQAEVSVYSLFATSFPVHTHFIVLSAHAYPILLQARRARVSENTSSHIDPNTSRWRPTSISRQTIPSVFSQREHDMIY